jgi:hypothetical protein
MPKSSAASSHKPESVDSFIGLVSVLMLEARADKPPAKCLSVTTMDMEFSPAQPRWTRLISFQASPSPRSSHGGAARRHNYVLLSQCRYHSQLINAWFFLRYVACRWGLGSRNRPMNWPGAKYARSNQSLQCVLMIWFDQKSSALSSASLYQR